MSIIKKLKKIKDALAALVFVPKCASCLSVLPAESDALCKKCKEIYELESKYSCHVCGRAHKMCVCKIQCEGRNYPFVHITAYDINRNSVSKSIILNIKETNFAGAFDFLAENMYSALIERYPTLLGSARVYITYVPRSEKARKRAGHDQSYQIAKRISELSSAPVIKIFENHSKKQQKKLNAAQRRENAKSNYTLSNEPIDLNQTVLIIVDDIVTTGASIGACADLAKKVGAKAVIGLVCARAESKKSQTENKYIILGDENYA